MNDAFGNESRRLRASPSIKSYWLRCASSAMTMMLPGLGNSGALETAVAPTNRRSCYVFLHNRSTLRLSFFI